MPPTPPNLLFIMSDHQRADSIGMVQAGHEVTPTLNQLAAEATTFTRAYNTCALCVPARTALATGLPPHTTGVTLNDWKGASAGDHQPMHQFLAEAGYRLGHVGVHHVRVKPPIDERVDFATWDSNPDYHEYVKAKGLSLPDPDPYRRACRELCEDGTMKPRTYSNTRTGVFPYPREDFLDCQFTEAACQFLRESSDQPFALFVYLWAPHPPLVVPEPYASLFDPQAIELPANVGRRSQGEPPILRNGVPAQLAEGLTEREWRDVWAAHLGLVRLVDDCVSCMLRTLEESGNRSNTAIVFTDDHGDHLGAHCMYQKMEMYEEAIHVPLLIRVPGAAPRRHTGLVSHLDLLPTVLDLAGLDVPDGLPGRSLRDVVCEGATFDREAVFSCYDGNPEVGDLRRAVVGTRFKYIWHPHGGEELYDLERDPLELVNVATDPALAPEKERLRTLGRDWARATGDRVEWQAIAGAEQQARFSN